MDYTKRFEKVAKAVAKHISEWRPNSPDSGTGSISFDGVWCEKQQLSFFLFLKFQKFSHAYAWNGVFSENLRNIGDIELSKNCAVKDIPPFLPTDDEHPIYDQHFLNAIFDEFLGEYSPPEDNGKINVVGVWVHLWAIHLFYSEIGYHLKNVHLEALLKIDLALTKLAFIAGAIIKEIRIVGPRDKDRTHKTYQTVSNKTLTWQQKALAIMNNPECRAHNGMKPGTAAYWIRKQWPQFYSEDAEIVKVTKSGRSKTGIPSERSLRDFLKEYCQPHNGKV